MVGSYSLFHQRAPWSFFYLVVVGSVLRLPCSNWKFEALQTPLAAIDFKEFRTFLLHFSVLNAVGFLSRPFSPASMGSQPCVPALPSPRRMY